MHVWTSRVIRLTDTRHSSSADTCPWKHSAHPERPACKAVEPLNSRRRTNHQAGMEDDVELLGQRKIDDGLPHLR